MPEKRDGQKIIRIIEIIYPGIRIYFKLNPATDFHIARPIAIAVPTDKKIEAGDPITIDMGCKVNGYCSDKCPEGYIKDKNETNEWVTFLRKVINQH